MEQIDRNRVRAGSFGRDHNLSGNRGASGSRSRPPLSATGASKVDFESAVLLSLRCPPDVIRKLESEARQARVGLIQAAIASGVYKPEEVYAHLSRKLSLANGATPGRLHLPSAPDRAWMLLEKPVPLAAHGEDVVALNGQTSSMQTLITLAVKLGEKRKRLKLVTRQELIDLVTQSHGRVLVARAIAGLMKAHPDWSAKTGLASWQVYFGAIITGLLLGALAFAPRETLTLAAIALSLFFLLAILLRLAAVASLLAPAASRERRLPPLLSDAELPRYTVFVPLFKEVEILPHLAKALRRRLTLALHL